MTAEARRFKAIGAGDTVVVTRLDRLARSTRDLLNILDAIAKAGAEFKSLADAWADTTTPHGRLMLTHLRGSGTGQGPRQAHGPTAEADTLPAPGGVAAA
jgi:Resolvase, N terminal domain